MSEPASAGRAQAGVERAVAASGPQAGGHAYSYRIAAVTALSGFLFGFDTAIINGAILFLRRQFGWNDVDTEIAAGSLLAGCAAGAAIAGVLSDRYGRKIVLLLSAAIFATFRELWMPTTSA